MPWMFPMWDSTRGDRSNVIEPERETMRMPRGVHAQAMALSTAALGIKDGAEREASRNAREHGRPSVGRLASVGSREDEEARGFQRNLPDEGVALPPHVREEFEERFGRSFRDVRIHTGPAASESAREAKAAAYTVGSHLVFDQSRFDPGTRSGHELLTHELTHVAQQESSGPVVQRQQQQPAPIVGTVATIRDYVMNPAQETDQALQSALRQIDRYRPTVRLDQVRFEVMPAEEQSTPFGHDLKFSGRSRWDNNTPVIELPQDALDVIARQRAGQASQSQVLDVIRTVGHEMHHLWRDRQPQAQRTASNPLQPAWESYYRREMEQVHQNWLERVQNDRNLAREMGIAEGKKIKTWNDIPAAQRESIESDVARLDPFEGAYQRSAYIVEEIYTKIEELSYLRIQQRLGSSASQTAARSAVGEMASTIYFLHNVLHSVAAEDNPIVTPQRLTDTDAAMLAYLRKRYPHPTNPSVDSYEVLFFLSAIRGGLVPLFDSTGTLVSVPPPGSRVGP